MVTGLRTIQNTWPLVSNSNRTRDIKSWKVGFSHRAFWNILIKRTIVRFMILWWLLIICAHLKQIQKTSLFIGNSKKKSFSVWRHPAQMSPLLGRLDQCVWRDLIITQTYLQSFSQLFQKFNSCFLPNYINKQPEIFIAQQTGLPIKI